MHDRIGKKYKFEQIAMAAKNAIENFNDFSEDRAISWAYDEIIRLREALTEIASMNTPFCDSHLSVNEMKSMARAALGDA